MVFDIIEPSHISLKTCQREILLSETQDAGSGHIFHRMLIKLGIQRASQVPLKFQRRLVWNEGTLELNHTRYIGYSVMLLFLYILYVHV